MIKMIADLITELMFYTVSAGCILMLITFAAEILGMTTLLFVCGALSISLLTVGFFAMVVLMFIDLR